MRALLVLCASTAVIASSAYAQDSTTAERLKRAAFAERPSPAPLVVPLPPYDMVFAQKFVVKPAYAHAESAESWRLPESGRTYTTDQADFEMYRADHPWVDLGVSALMRRNRHEDDFGSRSFNGFSNHFGHEPNETKVMLGLKFKIGVK